MTLVRSYPQGEFPAPLKWQAIAFMRVEWPFVFTGPGRLISETYPPALDPVHFVAAEGDALISYAAILRLTLAHARTDYDVYGFGNMFTFPPYRREGHGQRVLECATAYIRNSDVDIAILFCDAHLEAFYARCGWEAIRSPTYVGPADAQHEHPASKMMLFLSAKGQAQRGAFEAEPLCVDDAW